MADPFPTGMTKFYSTNGGGAIGLSALDTRVIATITNFNIHVIQQLPNDSNYLVQQYILPKPIVRSL